MNQLARDSNYASFFEYDMPWSKDGYLATNSLIATSVLLYRAYQASFEFLLPACPLEVEDLLEECIEIEQNSKQIFLNSISNDRTKSLLVVTGLSGQIAGTDLESRIAESALGTCQVVDFRSFAHGRHLWALENKDNAVSIVIWSDEDADLYQNFVQTVPSTIPTLSIKLKGRNYLRQLASMITVVQLIDDFSKVYGVDPGQPEVPQSSRDIYELDAFAKQHTANIISDKEWSVIRKFGGAHKYGSTFHTQFLESYDKFIQQLNNTVFGAIVFDYDATLCTPDKRYEDIDPVVADVLNNLLEKGIKIGIATGRGKSVPERLVKSINEKFHNDFLIGMYNGSNLITLSADLKSVGKVSPPFEQLMRRIDSEPFFASVFQKIETRPTQITFETKDGTCCELAWRTICELLQDKEFEHLKALRSTHSWDVIERCTSKSIVTNQFVEKGLNVLSIGDRGLWPGNDCELLSQGLGLGVDEVSPLIQKAWNIAPRGLKGVGATLYYLNQLNILNGTFTYKG